MGKGINEGYVPYVNLFDHKGIIVYLINYIPYLLHSDRFVLFIIECLFATFDFIFVFKISNLFINPKESFFSSIFFLIFLAGYSERGNCSEEWSLPFIIYTVYLALDYIKDYKDLSKHPLINSYIYGICIGFLLMIRVNNSIPCFGVILGFTILMLKNGLWMSLFKNALFVILGIATVLTPIMIYFYSNAIFEEFIYGNLIFNLIYAAQTSVPLFEKINDIFIVRSVPTIVFFICAYNLLKNKKIKNEYLVMMISIVVPTMINMGIGGGYAHYWLINVMSFVFSFSLLMRLKGKRNKILTATIILFMILSPMIYCVKNASILVVDNITDKNSFTRKFADALNISKLDFVENKIIKYETKANAMDEINNIISEEDKKEVFSYNIDPSNYFPLGIMPYKGCRFFYLQKWHSEFDVRIANEIKEMFADNPPKYVLVDNIFNVEDYIAKELDKNYIKLYSNISEHYEIELYIREVCE